METSDRCSNLRKKEKSQFETSRNWLYSISFFFQVLLHLLFPSLLNSAFVRRHQMSKSNLGVSPITQPQLLLFAASLNSVGGVGRRSSPSSCQHPLHKHKGPWKRLQLESAFATDDGPVSCRSSQDQFRDELPNDSRDRHYLSSKAVISGRQALLCLYLALGDQSVLSFL
ncbi:hypothetical protein B0I37DRAFT_52589 [Chaetomium sp. MPI-CAGE-AT-0009]|nr:hypothetical protein B0I37DRAFT_52589 [Chaetomium sp. MPI-CAGE-AT-0009]